jgi:hypothetical protein
MQETPLPALKLTKITNPAALQTTKTPTKTLNPHHPADAVAHVAHEAHTTHGIHVKYGAYDAHEPQRQLGGVD